ncbi:hypothetical protein ACFFX0_31290 [Citricoccus parietis]|uniref:Secreted protein n=1 Tax=Citricoccus parietis TaxID=592307 RepID=A0ABV5G8Z1_9MICC
MLKASSRLISASVRAVRAVFVSASAWARAWRSCWACAFAWSAMSWNSRTRSLASSSSPRSRPASFTACSLRPSSRARAWMASDAFPMACCCSAWALVSSARIRSSSLRASSRLTSVSVMAAKRSAASASACSWACLASVARCSTSVRAAVRAAPQAPFRARATASGGSGTD